MYKNYFDSLFTILNLRLFYCFIKNNIYNFFIGNYTQILYKDVLSNLPDNSKILDVGIGNGFSLTQNYVLLKQKNIKVDGIDINQIDINFAQQNVNLYDLNNHVNVECKDIFTINSKNYDYIYFSNSYSVIPDIDKMINHCRENLLKIDGEIIISTTLEHKYNYYKNFLKSNLKFIPFLFDLGRLVILSDFINDLALMNFTIEKINNIYNYWLPFWGNINIYTIHIKNKN